MKIITGSADDERQNEFSGATASDRHNRRRGGRLAEARSRSMRPNSRLPLFAALLAALGACALGTGCHIAINMPPGPGTGDAGQQSAPAASPTGTAPASPPTGQGVTQAGYTPSSGEGGLTPVGYVAQAHPDGEPAAVESGAPAPVGPGAPAPVGPAGPGCNGQGCGGPGGMDAPLNNGPIPRELDKVSLPTYIIEPPDILLIDIVRGTPLPPYHIEPFDVLQIQVLGALPNEPISGLFVVEPDGTVNLGLSYGSVPVGGLTLEQARAAIDTQLRRILKEPRTVVALAQTRGIQQMVRGEHLVRPDGTISLGVYGCVYVAGLNLCQAREAIERYLSQFLLRPQVSLDVLGYNSKVYYVIFDGGGYGQQIYRLPITGNETVLDAIGLVNGLPAVSSKKKIWVARPSPCGNPCDQVLPVDWNAITQGGSTCTNYQILPGDRIFVRADPWITFDNNLAKVMAPFERMLGFALLTQSVINFNRNNNGNGNGTAFVGVVP
jgi:protein involved in polysaccharide export with SLBB domain